MVQIGSNHRAVPGGIDDLDLKVRTADSIEQVANVADVLCTLILSAESILHGCWLFNGTHLNVMGAAPRADERNVDGDAMGRSRAIVDSLSTALSKSGDALHAIAARAILKSDIDIELGDVHDRPQDWTVDGLRDHGIRIDGHRVEDLAVALW